MSTPTWTSDCGTVKLWLGDCLDVMAGWEDGAVDAVVTDPPFNAGKDFDNDDQSDGEWTEWCERLAAHLHGLGALNYLVEVGKNDAAMRTSLDRLLRYRWAICLNYTNSMRQGAVGFANFGLVLWYGGKCFQRFMDRIDCNLNSTIGKFSHPSPKEVGHYTQLCRMFTPAISTVADPFMGSGTTGVAAVRLGREFWGVEIDPEYFEIAKQRIKAELERFPLLEGVGINEPKQTALEF